MFSNLNKNKVLVVASIAAMTAIMVGSYGIPTQVALAGGDNHHEHGHHHHGHHHCHHHHHGHDKKGHDEHHGHHHHGHKKCHHRHHHRD